MKSAAYKKSRARTFNQAFAIIFGLTLVFVVANDFWLNVEWKPELLEGYGEFGEGVLVAEVKYGLENDIILAFSDIASSNGLSAQNTTAYYKERVWLMPPIIKLEKNHTDSLPHELAHHFWFSKMNESERDWWCTTFNWTDWSYDKSCREGFAEFFGYSVISNAPLVEILGYNLTDGITKWREKENDTQ